MSRMALAGGRGFLGWHTRCAAASRGTDASLVALGDDFDLALAAGALEGSSRLVHAAGVKRGPESEVRGLNRAFAEQVAEALLRTSNPPPLVVFANSAHSGDGSPYGAAKAEAAEVLARAAATVGAEFIDTRFPEIFGEHGTPDDDSVVATLCEAIATGGAPSVDRDRELTLIHAQDAADVLLGHAAGVAGLESVLSAGQVLERIRDLADAYAAGDFPDLEGTLARNLFNTYRSYVFDHRRTVGYSVHRDARGSLVELARSRGGAAQTAVSLTVPGATRAEHFHRRKVERIVPLSGKVTVALRRMFASEVMTIDLDSAEPTAVDIPTLWTHSFRNPGPGELLLMFWASPLHDAGDPDTYPEAV